LIDASQRLCTRESNYLDFRNSTGQIWTSSIILSRLTERNRNSCISTFDFV